VTSARATDRPRRAMRALSDAALIEAMRDGSADAWQEYMTRFGPLLEHYGRRMRMPPTEWTVSVATVLEDAAIRWIEGGSALPASMAGYLLRAANLHRMTLERDERRRTRRYERAGPSFHREGVLVSLCSEAAVRDSEPSSDAQSASTEAITHLSEVLRAGLSEDEELILAWLGDGLPHREIAELLGMGYEATRKRIQRLCAKVRGRLPCALQQLSANDRVHAERLLRHLSGRRKPTGGKDDAV
jgi:DNA-directed RNA polymerase specialized sigma24 family protein